MTTKLTASNVANLFNHCLYKVDEPFVADETRTMIGLVTTAQFHEGRIKENDLVIKELLEQLPNEFLSAAQGGGGGWSFLNMPSDKDGMLWGQQRDAEALMLLAMAAGYMTYCLKDRKDWHMLPGGVPYIEWSRTKYKSKGDSNV
jgi:hypothetical protein